jgi:hypothetical protein
MLTKPNWVLLVLLIFTASLSRVIPHAPNFTPILSIALFSGASFDRKYYAYIIPLAAMILSDALIGFHILAPSIYFIMALIAILGSYIREINAKNIIIMSTISAVIFFVLSNVAVWVFTPYYAKTLTGLGACFIAALPFFTNTIMSAWLYSAIMFGIAALAKFKKQEKHSLC